MWILLILKFEVKAKTRKSSSGNWCVTYVTTWTRTRKKMRFIKPVTHEEAPLEMQLHSLVHEPPVLLLTVIKLSWVFPHFNLFKMISYELFGVILMWLLYLSIFKLVLSVLYVFIMLLHLHRLLFKCAVWIKVTTIKYWICYLQVLFSALMAKHLSASSLTQTKLLNWTGKIIIGNDNNAISYSPLNNGKNPQWTLRMNAKQKKCSLYFRTLMFSIYQYTRSLYLERNTSEVEWFIETCKRTEFVQF